jgi:hypothetical protein
MHILLFSLLLTAPGDVAWIGLPSETVDVTAPEKILVGTAVNGAFGVSAANVVEEICEQNLVAQYRKGMPLNWHCRVTGESPALTDSQFWIADLAGQIKDPTDPAVPKRASTNLTAEQIVQHEVVTQALFALGMIDIYQIKIYRDPDIPSKIWARYFPINTGTKTEYRAARVAGLVTLPIAEVPQGN